MQYLICNTKTIYGRGALAFWGFLLWVFWRNCTAKPCSHMRVKYVNMAARRNLQSLSNLVKAITRLSQNSSDGNDEGSEDMNVEETIRSLFPSTNGQACVASPQQGISQSNSRVLPNCGESSSNTPDRRICESSERFVPNRNYGGKKRSKALKNNSTKKPRNSEQRTN